MTCSSDAPNGPMGEFLNRSPTFSLGPGFMYSSSWTQKYVMIVDGRDMLHLHPILTSYSLQAGTSFVFPQGHSITLNK